MQDESMKRKPKHIVTAALPYANGIIHFGHLAGAYLPADIYVRYLTFLNHNVIFVCGSDSHGTAIEIEAHKEGMSPSALVDIYHNANKELLERCGIWFNEFIRTDDTDHKDVVNNFFQKLFEEGCFEERIILQYYDDVHDSFLADRYVKGQCPHCNGMAYADQCEVCGKPIANGELISPISQISLTPPIMKETKHLFFKLNVHEKWLSDYIEHGVVDGKQHHLPETWKDHVVGQCMSWINSGLTDRCITRDISWGIKVPSISGDEFDKKVLYVWFEAPIGYITAVQKAVNGYSGTWEEFWKNPDCKLTQFIGKDNIVFHGIIFPAMLKAHGEGFILPTNVPANCFLNYEGDKFSKSKNWGIDLMEYFTDFDAFAGNVDALRYCLIKNMPENRDSNFKWDDYVSGYDKELADNVGNLFNRFTSLIYRNYNNIIPSGTVDTNSKHILEIQQLFKDICSCLDKFEFKNALAKLMQVASTCNAYIQQEEPWKTDDVGKSSNCLYNTAQILFVFNGFLRLFLPDISEVISEKVFNLVDFSDYQEFYKLDGRGSFERYSDYSFKNVPSLPEYYKIGDPLVLFPKIKGSPVEDIIDRQKAKLIKK